jgi:excisionase family DNA binding protein
MDRDLMTREQAAEYLGVSIPTLKRYVDECGLPRIVLGRYGSTNGGKVRFRREALAEWVKSQEESNVCPPA